MKAITAFAKHLSALPLNTAARSAILCLIFCAGLWCAGAAIPSRVSAQYKRQRTTNKNQDANKNQIDKNQSGKSQSGRNQTGGNSSSETSNSEATRTTTTTQTPAAANSLPPSSLPPPPPPPSSLPSHAASIETNARQPSENANTADAQIFDSDEEVNIRSNLVPIAASAVDAQGQAVKNLTLKDFELQVDGKVKPISDIHRSETPVRLVMLFDNSQSLSISRELEKQAALRFFRNVVRPVDKVAIFSVATTVKIEQQWTNDVTVLTRTIDNFQKPDGATALFDAIVLASTYLRPHTERKIILIVSDGVDTLSDSTFDIAMNMAQEADCQIYAVQTGFTTNANLSNPAADNRLRLFTEQTGGAVYKPQTTNDIDKAFAQVAADLSQQYILSYYATGEPADGKFRRISLRLPAFPQTRIRTRKGFYAPKS